MILFFVLSCSGVHAQRRTPATPKMPEKIWIWLYLPQMARHLNCFYTLELKPDNLFTGPGVEDVTDDQSIKTVSALVKKLQKELSTFAVSQDEGNPRIIHLKAASLTNDKRYVLDQKTTINYVGRLRFLPDTLGQQNHLPIITQYAFSEAVISIDNSTLVRFSATNSTIRSILTDYVPLAHYNRLLWYAETKTREGKVYTQVNYNGPAVPTEAIPLKSHTPTVSK